MIQVEATFTFTLLILSASPSSFLYSEMSCGFRLKAVLQRLSLTINEQQVSNSLIGTSSVRLKIRLIEVHIVRF
jgi:hypothetical protein